MLTMLHLDFNNASPRDASDYGRSCYNRMFLFVMKTKQRTTVFVIFEIVINLVFSTLHSD